MVTGTMHSLAFFLFMMQKLLKRGGWKEKERKDKEGFVFVGVQSYVLNVSFNLVGSIVVIFMMVVVVLCANKVNKDNDNNFQFFLFKIKIVGLLS